MLPFSCFLDDGTFKFIVLESEYKEKEGMWILLDCDFEVWQLY